MKLLLKSLTLAALMLTLTGNAFAQQRANRQNNMPQNCMAMGQGQGQGMNQDAMHQRMMSMLDLNEDQKTLLENIHLNGQKAMLPMRNKVQEMNAKLITLSMADEYDQLAINEQIREISDLQADMRILKFSHRNQIRRILDENQRIKFDNFHQKAMQRMQGQKMRNK